MIIATHLIISYRETEICIWISRKPKPKWTYYIPLYWCFIESFRFSKFKCLQFYIHHLKQLKLHWKLDSTCIEDDKISLRILRYVLENVYFWPIQKDAPKFIILISEENALEHCKRGKSHHFNSGAYLPYRVSVICSKVRNQPIQKQIKTPIVLLLWLIFTFNILFFHCNLNP